MLQLTLILSNSDVCLALVAASAVNLVTRVLVANLVSIWISPHHYVQKLVEMVEDLLYLVMTEITLMEMDVVMTVKFK
jgi:hypothetical protein